jgi:hypothetical protein
MTRSRRVAKPFPIDWPQIATICRYSNPITALSAAQPQLGAEDPICGVIHYNTLTTHGEAIAVRTPTPAPQPFLNHYACD